MTRMPAGYDEYLALKQCDDGAMGDVSFEKVPNDSTMVRVKTMWKRTALDSMGWTGFKASDM